MTGAPRSYRGPPFPGPLRDGMGRKVGHRWDFMGRMGNHGRHGKIRDDLSRLGADQGQTNQIMINPR